jgi:hypothetical protein
MPTLTLWILSELLDAELVAEDDALAVVEEAAAEDCAAEDCADEDCAATLVREGRRTLIAKRTCFVNIIERRIARVENFRKQIDVEEEEKGRNQVGGIQTALKNNLGNQHNQPQEALLHAGLT